MQSSRNAAVGMLPPPDETSCSSATGGLAPRYGRVGNGMVAKALLEMIERPGAVAEIGQHSAESLMRRRVVRIDPQSFLVIAARLGVLVGAQQQVGEVHMPHRIHWGDG